MFCNLNAVFSNLEILLTVWPYDCMALYIAVHCVPPTGDTPMVYCKNRVTLGAAILPDFRFMKELYSWTDSR